MKSYLFCLIVLITSCSSPTPKTSWPTEKRVGDTHQLKECIRSDQAIAELNIEISQLDDKIVKTMSDRSSVASTRSINGKIDSNMYWDAALISVKLDLESMTEHRVELVRNVSLLNEELVTECRNVQFSKSVVNSVCNKMPYLNTRWCLTKFF